MTGTMTRDLLRQFVRARLASKATLDLNVREAAGYALSLAGSNSTKAISIAASMGGAFWDDVQAMLRTAAVVDAVS